MQSTRMASAPPSSSEITISYAVESSQKTRYIRYIYLGIYTHLHVVYSAGEEVRRWERMCVE